MGLANFIANTALSGGNVASLCGHGTTAKPQSTNEDNVVINEDDFDYGKLGRDWWLEAGESCRATPTQIKFACARHAGATRAKSAELAGYSASDSQGLRVAGSRADDTQAVIDLLTMACAASVGASDDPFTLAQARAKVGRMAKTSLDPTVVVKCTELMAKLDQVDRERGQTPDDDGLNPWRVERDFLMQPNGAVAYVLMHIDGPLMGNLANLNLLHDTYAMLMQQPLGPELVERCRARLNDDGRADLDAKLANKDWQREVRQRIWSEVSVRPDGNGGLRMKEAA
jgi:hypothetical protein